MEAVSLWHDTAMWSEGFERASVPLTTVNLSTAEEAQELIDWVEEMHGLFATVGIEGYLARHDSVIHGQPVVTVEEAKKVFNAAIGSWGGP